jgi:hypothetical protein
VAQVACNLCGEAARGNHRQPAVTLVAARHGLQATRATLGTQGTFSNFQ